jgi:hypothetical protein
MQAHVGPACCGCSTTQHMQAGFGVWLQHRTMWCRLWPLCDTTSASMRLTDESTSTLPERRQLA